MSGSRPSHDSGCAQPARATPPLCPSAPPAAVRYVIPGAGSSSSTTCEPERRKAGDQPGSQRRWTALRSSTPTAHGRTSWRGRSVRLEAGAAPVLRRLAGLTSGRIDATDDERVRVGAYVALQYSRLPISSTRCTRSGLLAPPQWTSCTAAPSTTATTTGTAVRHQVTRSWRQNASPDESCVAEHGGCQRAEDAFVLHRDWRGGHRTDVADMDGSGSDCGSMGREELFHATVQSRLDQAEAMVAPT